MAHDRPPAEPRDLPGRRRPRLVQLVCVDIRHEGTTDAGGLHGEARVSDWPGAVLDRRAGRGRRHRRRSGLGRGPRPRSRVMAARTDEPASFVDPREQALRLLLTLIRAERETRIVQAVTARQLAMVSPPW